DKYKVYNLCSERLYDASLFEGKCKITWRILIGVATDYVIRQPIPEGNSRASLHLYIHVWTANPSSRGIYLREATAFQQSTELGLSLDQGKGADGAAAPGVGFLKPPEEASGSGKRFRDDVLDARAKNVFHGQPMPTTIPAAPHPPTMRPRVRARRGQATDPHSIAERLRKERIAERIRALQELVPSVNK
ncbi:hypothetical protein S83_066517, partial [Arachis hypogaea]